MLELARPGDRSAVEALAQQLHALHLAWRPDLYQAAELYPQDRFDLAVKQRQLYVARLADTVVGYVLAQREVREGPGLKQRTVMTIQEFCVHESCRSQGIGKQMMEEVWALSRAFGCTDLQLTVAPENDPAVGFYQKCGFTIRNIAMQRKV